MGKKGQSVVEFTATVLFILAAFLVFQKYIVRGLSGRWKGIGDSLGQGKIYDPNRTIECAFDPPTGVWFDRDCYETSCSGACFPTRGGGCDPCIITTCHNVYCDE